MGARNGHYGIVPICLLASCSAVVRNSNHLHKEAQLPGGVVGRTLQDLGGEVGSEGHNLAGHEAVTPLVTQEAQGRPAE